MAGDWIKMRIDLMEDPAVMQMADELGVREEAVVGYCHALWSWVSRQCHDDTVTGVTLTSLGRRINLPGFPEMMCDVGWLEYDDSGDRPVIRIPNWDRHLSQSAKKRGIDAIRQAKRRQSVTQASRSTRDNSVTREEKRREEYYSLTQAKGFEDHWKKWCDYVFEKDGVRINEIEAQTTVFKLCQVGAEKAKRDIDFSILKRAKSILDSNNDFSQGRNGKTASKEKLNI